MDLCDRRPTARGVPRDDPDNYSKINRLEISAVVRPGSASPSIGIRCPQEDISRRGGVNSQLPTCNRSENGYLVALFAVDN